MDTRNAPETVNVSDARHQLPRLLNQVYSKSMRIVVKNREIPVAAIVPIGDLRQLERAEPQRSNVNIAALSGAAGSLPKPMSFREMKEIAYGDRLLAKYGPTDTSTSGGHGRDSAPPNRR